MSTPTITRPPVSHIPYAHPPVASTPPARQSPASAAAEASREEATRQRGGRLGGLFRLNRPRQPVDVETKLNADVRRVLGNGGDPSTVDRLGAEGVMGDEASARAEIELMLPGISQQFVDRLLQMRESCDMPIYGNAPRYAHALVLAAALAKATGGNATRAQDVVNTWNLLAEDDPAKYPETVRADDLATQCMLAKTELGWDMLTALAPSRYVSLKDTDDQRRQMTTALKACAHLLESLPFADGAFPTPRSIEDVVAIARDIVAQGTPDGDEPLPNASTAFGYERNVIAARALIGSCSGDPTPRECEAIVLFRSGERDIRNVSMMRHRMNQMFGDNNERRGIFGRMPTMDQRVMDTLARRTMSDLVEHLETRLAPPKRMENGRLVTDRDFVAQLTPERIRETLHLVALKAFENRVDSRSRRSSIDLKRGEFRGLLDATAHRLGITAKELSRHPAWRAAHAECRQLDLDKLRSWMREVDVDPDTSAMGQHLQTLDDMRGGMASRADGMRELVKTLRPGSSVAFTSRGAKGPNVTLWSTIAPLAWAAKWGHPTVTPLPTVAHIRGRGAAVVLSGDEGPDGAYIDVDIGTFDRKSWTFLAGVVAQIHSPENFWWQVFEVGRQGSTDNPNGLKVRIKADTFEQAQERACDFLAMVSDTKSESSKGSDGWRRGMKSAYADDNISVHHQQSEDKERVRIAQTMTVLGQNTPFGSEVAVPPNKYLSWGVNDWWNAVAMQLSRTKGTLTSRTRGANDETRTSMRREHHTTLGGLTYPLPSLTAPGPVPVLGLGPTGLSGGHGAWWVPMKRFTKGLERGDTFLRLPQPGSNETPYQEWAMTELEYLEWTTELWGKSSPTPPVQARNEILRDRPESARGSRLIVVRRYPTPAAMGRLQAHFDKAQTMRGDPSAGPAIQRELDAACALMQTESSWGDHQVWDEYTEQREKVTGLPPLGYQNQHFVGTVERNRELLSGRKGGRNTVIGTRVPEKLEPGADAENGRIFRRNLPTRFAPAQPRMGQSSMQQLIRDIFAHYPEEWMPVDPVVMPSHMDNFGHLFHLLQMRDDVYPAGSPILRELHEYLGTTDGMAVVDCRPKRDPAEIMKDFEIARNRYVMWRWPVDEPLPENFDEIDKKNFWSEFDLATFFKDNFEPPYRPLAKNPPARQDTLAEHIEVYRQANRLDMSNPARYSSMIELPGDASVPSNRFILEFQWDEMLNAMGQLSTGTPDSIERVLRIIRNKQYLINKLGYDPNANGTHFTGRTQPLTLGLIAESYANHTGNDDILVEILPQLMAELRSALRGADELLPGQIFNGVAMLPDGRVQVAPYDYAAYKGARPESYREDKKEFRQEQARDNINPAFMAMHKRMGAATGIDYSDAQLNPDDRRPELPYMLPLQQNAHLVRTLAVAKRALGAAAERGTEGAEEMARMIGQLHQQWVAAMQATFLVKREDIKLTRGPNGTPAPVALTVGGSYFRLKEGKLHPALTAEIANALWAGIVPENAMAGTINRLKELITPEGIMASELTDSTQQWDGQNYWAMHAYKAVEGLYINDQVDLARQVAIAYCENARKAFSKDGKTAEKFKPKGEYGGGGEYSVEFNMTMTNETLAYFGSLFPECAAILADPVVQKVAV